MKKLSARPARPRSRRSLPSYPRLLLATGLALNAVGCMGAAPAPYEPATPGCEMVQHPAPPASTSYAQPPPASANTVAVPPEEPNEVMLDGEAPAPFEEE